ncbi:hypothetical protein CVD27_07000 [Neobacillus cucumis]|uniref:Uncharacterized protein n=1 Tax=Neobacillus cucumis TaxID=1740721 RepID=A0A2N5HME3_9BACI|nr:hypothetical protein CVD27_07000 [Neobacillus cucumis]
MMTMVRIVKPILIRAIPTLTTASEYTMWFPEYFPRALVQWGYVLRGSTINKTKQKEPNKSIESKN